MRRTNRAPLLLAAAGLAGCAAPGFHYTAQLRDGTVIPILKNEVGKDFAYYNYERPMIAANGDDIAIILGWDFVKGGDLSPDPPYVTILLDPKTRAVRRVTLRRSDQ